MVQFYKRLDRSKFPVPEPPTPNAPYIEVDEVEFETLLDGIPIEPQSETKPKRPRLH